MPPVPRLNLIGGYAYCVTGGIEAVNRFIVRETAKAGLLRKAFFLWDNAATASAEGREMMASGRVRGFSANRAALGATVFRHGVRHPRDIWLCTHVNYALFGLFVSLARARRVGVFVHAAELDDRITVLKRFALRRARRVLANSEYTKRKAVALGVDPARVTVVPLGCEDPNPNGKLREPGASPVVLFVGRMDERYKGQMELIDAMAILHRRFPALRLVFVGGGRNLDEWRQQAKLRGLQEQISFRGRVSDEELRQAYDAATIFAMPSHNEGFGLVYAEAMAHGLPCIGGERDAAREVIAHGETGLCVPAGNSTALADAVRTMLVSPELCRRYGAASRARFESHYSAQRYAARLIAALQTWQHALA